MRYLPLSEQDKKEMLTDIGVSKTEDLFKDIPCQNNGTVKPFAAKDEIALSREFKEIADKNTASEVFFNRPDNTPAVVILLKP